MQVYLFKYRRRLWWRTRKVIGHNFLPDQDKIVLYFANGGIEEIPRWKICAVRLGPDWVLAQKKALEEKTGQSIPVRGA